MKVLIKKNNQCIIKFKKNILININVINLLYSIYLFMYLVSCSKG